MKRCASALFFVLAASAFCQEIAPPAPCGAIPTRQQVEWLRMEWYAFVHFGLNTYTGREWGYGDESPSLFNPQAFDAEALVTTFQKAGMKGVIYTAKHHDGWCAWPTRTTQHSIAHSPWKQGQGDVVRELAEACRKHQFKLGIYLSPWDRNCAEYGRPGYRQVFHQQIEELLTQYGPLFEIWFDGANGGDGYYGGARETRSIGEPNAYYQFQEVTRMIRRLQPDCIIWGAGTWGDVKWGGSEQGVVDYPLWNKGNGNEDGEKWISWEADTTINRKGWFWHPGQEASARSPEELMDIYFQSVGRGANLILNLAPNREGRLDPADVRALMGFASLRNSLLAHDYALHAMAEASEVRGHDERFSAACVTDGDLETYWCPNDGTLQGTIEVKLPQEATFDVIRLREQIRLGQRVRRFQLDVWMNGEWKTVDAEGQTIGNQVLRRLAQPVTTDRVRLRILDSRACPCISEISLLRLPPRTPQPRISRRGELLEAQAVPGFRVVYTTDGSAPSASSPVWQPGTVYRGSGVIKAAFLDVQGNLGPVSALELGLCKKGWLAQEAAAQAAIDDAPDTLWEAPDVPSSFSVDLGYPVVLGSFSYLPRQDGQTFRMTDLYELSLSQDGIHWDKVAEGEFSNLRANPIEQKVHFRPTRAQYVRFTAKRSLEGSGASVAELNLYPTQQQEQP